MLKQVWACPILSRLVKSRTKVLFIIDFVILRQVQTCLDKHRLNMFELVKTCPDMPILVEKRISYDLFSPRINSIELAVKNEKCYL